MSISVILNGFKRSKHFKSQLEAIQNQTIKPNEILFWQNKGEDFDTSLTNQTIHASCNYNFGVWARFAYALNAKSEYICIFDDDTIPGKKWLENCLNTIKEHDGLLGTIGVKFLSETGYNPAVRVGWDKPNEKTEIVDIVGHSWFFKRDDLSFFWRELPNINQPTIVGEDIHFSYMLQKYANKKTYVPPHPVNDMEMWGSKPDVAWSIGTDDAAISKDVSNQNLMSFVYVDYIKKGFKILKNERKVF
jgi:hypothetical protein